MQRPVPSGHKPISLSQVVAADRQLFTLAAHALTKGLTSAAGQPRPLDTQIQSLSDSTEVLQFLHALPAPSGPALPAKRSADDPPAGRPPKGKGGRGGSGKGQGKGSPPQVPEGCVSKLSDGRHLCCAFNHGVCKFKVSKKGRCGRGFHLCWRIGCHGEHAGHTCPKA